MPEISLPAIGVYELGVAIFGLFVVASPPGQQAIKQTAQAVANGLTKASDDPVPVPVPVPTTGCAECEKKKCPPCPPPPPPRIDKVPPSRPHWPCTGDHMHVFEMNQNPVTCQCFPKEKEVICL